MVKAAKFGHLMSDHLQPLNLSNAAKMHALC